MPAERCVNAVHRFPREHEKISVDIRTAAAHHGGMSALSTPADVVAFLDDDALTGVGANASGAIVLGVIGSPLGPLLAGTTGDRVCMLEFGEEERLHTQLARLRRRFGGSPARGEHPLLERLRDELSRYFAGTLREFTVPLIYPGSEFEVRVWEALRRIPFGETRSYEELAHDVGVPGAARAVGRANGLNRLAILIPCHRVINKSGALGGYGGGLWRKQRLLELERASAQLGLGIG